jgi:MFS family permease
MFLFALPAGALADIVDRRRFLVGVEILITVISAIFAFLVWFGAVTPLTLLVFTFLAGVASALEAPAWQAIVPALVPKRDLQSSLVANGVGINISRALGPALAGIIVVAWGIAAPFWINAVSNIGVIVALVWWRSPQKANRTLPAERFINANRSGLRYAKNNPHLRATLIRAVSFFLFASAYWARINARRRDKSTHSRSEPIPRNSLSLSQEDYPLPGHLPEVNAPGRSLRTHRLVFPGLVRSDRSFTLSGSPQNCANSTRQTRCPVPS